MARITRVFPGALKLDEHWNILRRTRHVRRSSLGSWWSRKACSHLPVSFPVRIAHETYNDFVQPRLAVLCMPVSGSLHQSSNISRSSLSTDTRQVTTTRKPSWTTTTSICSHSSILMVSHSTPTRLDGFRLSVVGFVFSQTDNRLWRKNRQPPPENAANQTCFGRDVNRNWET